MRSRKLWLVLAIVTSVVIALVTYVTLRPKQQRTLRHPLTGYVLEVTPEMNRITVRNDDAGRDGAHGNGLSSENPDCSCRNQTG